MIPGTKVLVKCQECDSVGSLEKDQHEYYPHQAAISDISIRVGRYRTEPEITYSFACHVSTERFHAVCDTKEEAIEKAHALAERDEDGVVSTRWT